MANFVANNIRPSDCQRSMEKLICFTIDWKFRALVHLVGNHSVRSRLYTLGSRRVASIGLAAPHYHTDERALVDDGDVAFTEGSYPHHRQTFAQGIAMGAWKSKIDYFIASYWSGFATCIGMRFGRRLVNPFNSYDGWKDLSRWLSAHCGDSMTDNFTRPGIELAVELDWTWKCWIRL